MRMRIMKEKLASAVLDGQIKLLLLPLLLLLHLLLQSVHKIESLGFVEQVCYRMNDALPVTEATVSKH